MKIFVQGMDWNATEKEIKALFSEYGLIDEVKLVFHPGTPPRRRGFVFVVMEDEGEALKAILNLDGKPFKNRILHLERALSKEEFFARRDREYQAKRKEQEKID